MRILPHVCTLSVYLLLFTALAYSQDQYAFTGNRTYKSKVSYTAGVPEKQTLLSVLKDLNKQKGVYFLYSDENIGKKLVSPVTDVKQHIEKILDIVLDETGLKYKKVNGNTYVIIENGNRFKPKKDIKGAYVVSDISIHHKTVDPIKGRITNADGQPITGASITVKGTNRGTTSNSNGDFTLDVNRGETLVISSIGYESREVVVNDNNDISVNLSVSQGINETVVVTALGVKKQARSVGTSTTQVDGSKLTDSRATNLAASLTGQVAGVNVAGTSTGPYGSSRLVIRGNSSLNANNQPLYVIDGIPVDNSNAGSSGQWGGADYGDVLSTINPDNIESLTVLKSAAASALYGYRGGNGAILVTTKSGSRTRGIGVELNNNLTFNKVVDEREYQYVYGQGLQGLKPTTAASAQSSANMSWGSKLDGSQAVNFAGTNYNYSPMKDNFENFYQTGISNQTTLALTGSNDKAHFRLGLMNNYMKTVIQNSNLQQQGVTLNSMYNITPKFSAQVTADYVFERVKNRASFSDAPGNVIAGPLYLANSFDIRWLQPYVNDLGQEILPGADVYFNNSYFVAYNYQNATDRNRLTGGLTLKYQLLDWLSVQGQITRDGYTFDVTNILPSGTGYSPGGNLTQYTNKYRELNGGGSFEANRKFGKVGMRLIGGGNSQDNIWEQAGIFGAGPFKVPFFYSASNISDKPFTYNYSHYRVNSLYASADFDYNNFLFLTVTARNDWFSTLNINSNDVLYPSVSGSFVFSDVVNLPDFWSFGKLRASWAKGSNGAAPYKNLLTYGLQGYTINNQSVGFINQSEIPNNFLKPVDIEEYEVGLNLEFFGGRLGFDVAYYNKMTKDDILPVTISPTSGYTGNTVNIGSLRNRGVELLVTAVPVRTSSFSWTASFNIATNDNEVLALAPGQKSIVVNGAFPRWGNGVSIQHTVGLPFAQIYGYKYNRDASGNVIFDANGLPTHKALPEALGSGVYKTTGGFSNDLKWKNFTLNALIDFKYGAMIYSGSNLLLYNYGLHENTLVGREGGVVGVGVNAAGQKNTVNVPAQTYYQAISTGASHVSEEFVYDASFIKLRNLSVGYTIPASTFRNGPIKGLTIAIVGRNIATLMKRTPNIDPESNLNSTNAQGLELSGFPNVRNVGFNLNVKF